MARLLHLLRHGAPALPGRLLGRTDCAGTAAGVAACLAQADGLEIQHLACSDLARARAAADAIGAAAGLPITIDPRWRELDFGDWDGLCPGEVDAAALARFWADPDACPPPGGERWSALVARVAAAAAALAADGSDGPALVVTHGGAMRAALAALCGFGVAQGFAMDLPYACLLSLRLWPGERGPSEGAPGGAPPSAQIVGLFP